MPTRHNKKNRYPNVGLKIMVENIAILLPRSNFKLSILDNLIVQFFHQEFHTFKKVPFMCFAWSFRASIISGIPDSIIRSSFSSSSESAHITDIHSSQIEGTFNFVERILITSLKILCFEEVFNKSKVKINNLKMFLENTFKDFSAVAMAELHSFTHKVQRARKVVVTTESSENSMFSFRKS